MWQNLVCDLFSLHLLPNGEIEEAVTTSIYLLLCYQMLRQSVFSRRI